MNFLLRILIIGLCSYYYIDILPWWFLIIIPFILGLIFSENYISHFLSGFIGVSVAWLFLILEIDFENQSIISTKVIQILKIDSVNKLIIYTILIGGSLGGISSITGNALQRIFSKKNLKIIQSCFWL